MNELEKVLRNTFEDFRLSTDEKYNVKELLYAHKDDPDTISFVRNKAFDIVRQHMQEQDMYDASAFKWLEQIAKTIDSVRNAGSNQLKNDVSFSPGNNCKNRIISLINNARQSIDICVFTISDDDISEAVYSAYQRKINVKIITDNDKANDEGSDVDYLSRKGIPVVKDHTDNHMHHKFAVIDSTWLINGSFNWTRSASQYNNENITVLTDPELVKKFAEKFEELWQEFQ